MKQLFGCLLLFFCSCSLGCNDQQDNGVPTTTVNINIDLNSPAYQALNAVGGSVQIPGGFRGIIVYRYSETEFMAYDRTCTYLPDQSNSIVSLDSIGLHAIDTSCGSEFELFAGTPTAGPAKQALQRYTTSLNEFGTTLFIRN